MKNKASQRARQIIRLARNQAVLENAAERVALSGALTTANKSTGGIGDIVKEVMFQNLIAVHVCSGDIHTKKSGLRGRKKTRTEDGNRSSGFGSMRVICKELQMRVRLLLFHFAC